MKVLSTILILISNLTIYSQSDEVVGNYTLKLETVDKDVFEYQLTLSQDGTFSFHYYSYIKHGIPPEKNYYGKGKWTVENKVISFFSDKKNDFDEKYTMDFTGSKARFIIKSPRDKSDQIIKTRLKFLKSEVPWMGAIEMLKI